MPANDKNPQRSVTPAWLAIAACFVVATVEGFDLQILSIAAPRFAPELGFDSAALGLVFSAVSFGVMIGSTVGGRAGDVFGHRSVLVIAIAIFGVFTLATPFCETFESFLIVRLLTGVGFGVALPNLIALAANVAAEGRAFQTNAAVFWGVPLGGVIAAALFSYGIDWRAAFIAGGLAAIICIPFVIFTFRAPLARKEQELGALEGVAVLLARGYRLRSLLIWAIFMLAYIVAYFAAIWLPMIVSGKGFEPETAASVMLSYGLFGMLGVLVTGWACDRFSFQVPITLCWLLIVPVLIVAGFSEDWLSVE
jgi:MFS transporter, AAHS family, 3-hydroxyphenylpropionic acid transporter